MKKWPSNNPVARYVPLLATTPLVLEVEPGLTHLIALRGDTDDSTYEIESLLRSRVDGEVGAILEESAVTMDLFALSFEDTFATTGDVIRITRTHPDNENAPELFVAMILRDPQT